MQRTGLTKRNGDYMPKVGSKKYPYTKAGKAAAAKAKKRKRGKRK